MQKEIWVDYIVEHLYELGSSWINRLLDNDQFVLAGKVVHKPQRNGAATGEKNRSTYPATVKRHEANDATYALDVYTSDPEQILNTDKVELSYDALESAMRNKMNWFRQQIAKDAAYDMAAADSARGYAASKVIRTTGEAVSNHFGATGNRKLFTEADLQSAKFALNKQKIPLEMSTRTALIPSDMMQQLYDDLKSKYDYAFAKDVVDGTISTLHGFNIVEVTEGVRYGNESTPVAKYYSDNLAGTDNDSVQCFADSFVGRARGEVMFYDDLGNPLYYGDIHSAELRHKVQKEYADATGVISIVQAAA